MKEVHYTVYQKLTTILSSIIMGCESTKDINEVLSPEVLAANMLGMDHFPDQSQINLMLKRMDKESVDQLQNIHHELFMNYSSSVYSFDLVEKCSKVKGFVKRTSDGINIVVEPLSKLAKLLLEALSEPDYVQLSFLN